MGGGRKVRGREVEMKREWIEEMEWRYLITYKVNPLVKPLVNPLVNPLVKPWAISSVP